MFDSTVLAAFIGASTAVVGPAAVAAWRAAVHRGRDEERFADVARRLDRLERHAGFYGDDSGRRGD